MSNVLLLIVGLSLSIAGVLFIKKAKKRAGWFYLISGVPLMLIFLIYLLLRTKMAIPVQIILIVCILIFTTIKDSPPVSKKMTDKQDNIFKWSQFSVLYLVFLSIFLPLPKRLPPVTMDNGIIRMGGVFGGNFNIHEIQSVDTVQFFPKVILRAFGKGSAGIGVGDFKLQGEEKLAKLNIRTNKPPYISIRMNDNRLFLFNLKRPDETVEFYKQIKNELNSN